MNLPWVDFYSELATKLLAYKNNRRELIKKIQKVFDAVEMKLPKMESNGILRDLDPFTIFGTFNKGITRLNRITIAEAMGHEFGVEADVPQSFEGIPIVNNLRACFFDSKDDRGANDIQNLWNVFEAAIDLAETDSDDTRKTFIHYFNLLKGQKGIKWNITMGLYWIRPNTFVNLDKTNRDFISNTNNLPADFVATLPSFTKEVTGEEYLTICNDCRAALKTSKFPYRTFPEMSHCAWQQMDSQKEHHDTPNTGRKSNSYSRWIRPLIQALRDLGGSATCQQAYTTIAKNENLTSEELSQRTTKANKFEKDVQWARQYLVYAGYIANKEERGIWTLTETGKTAELTDELINDICKCRRSSESAHNDANIPAIQYPPYSVDDFLNEVYLSGEIYQNIVEALRYKKNVILQGAPGVGKTFIAKRLAYSILGTKDKERVRMVQFHQSYSYEDFIMGFRPTSKCFKMKPGTFYNFCKKAKLDSNNDYFFIIDEINRGNLSKIFGELFMLIENDKRGVEIQLLNSENFSIPQNIYIIGMMNTADRSLALLDYALRRRFAFIDLKPGFDTKGFESYCSDIKNKKFDQLIKCVKDLNISIASDEVLGEHFMIGHSYFCNLKTEDSEDIDELQFKLIVEFELIPLLKEYWFDEPEKVRDWSAKLREAIK